MSRTTILVKKKYLALPGSEIAASKCVNFYADGSLADSIDMRIDPLYPYRAYYYDISRYMGQELVIELPCDMTVSDIQLDEIPPQTELPYRPVLHFTPKRGWINDPNGLVEFTSRSGERLYHMFYQHNPYDTVWGNMHWGHAVSRDLIKWEEQPIALYPDRLGSMYSGSAIIDRDNVSRLGGREEDCLLLFYTAAGDSYRLSDSEKYSQCLAYSNDGGKSFKKYEGNPIMPHIKGGNRDPKVVMCRELGKYVMALYLAERVYRLFTSEDLLKWDYLQDLTIDGDSECPDIYPMEVEGEERKWVLSGASGKYVILKTEAGKFSPVGAPRRLSYGRYSYAAQSFSDVSDGRRINIAWHRDLTFPDGVFCGQMSIPMSLSLKKKEGEYVLCAAPVKELDRYASSKEEFKDVNVSPEAPLELPLAPSPYRISLSVSGKGVGQLSLFGRSIMLNFDDLTVKAADVTAPLPHTPTVELTLIVDRCSVEIFVGEGESVITAPAVADYNLCRLSVTADSSLKLHSLKSEEINIKS